jgi:hypothetical protein
METRIKDPLRGGEEVAAEWLYGDYRNIDGVMTAHRITIKYDSKTYIESDITDVRYAEKLEDGVFEKP